MANHDPHSLEKARRLYQDGMTAEEVAGVVGRTPRTVRNWIKAHGWKRGGSPETLLENAIEDILSQANQSEADLRRLDRYTSQLARLRKAGGKRKERVELARNKAKNKPHWYAHQRAFMDDPHPLRMVKKSRQIGFTHTMAYEGLEDALKTGRDKGFVSASLRQVAQMRRYVKTHARDFFGLKLQGTDTVRLPNMAELHFLPANPATIQGFTGDMYFDEFAWMLRAREIYENAAANATLDDYRITISSTPSVHSHYFEELWDADRNSLDISRREVDLISAIEGGYDRVNLEKLLGMFRPEAIRRLYMCETLDAVGSVFTFDEVMACVHEDESIFEPKPGEEIWGGLDISRWVDDTSIVLLAANQKGGKRLFDWREIIRMNRVPLPAQEQRVFQLLDTWHPTEFTIDRTTIGEHLADSVAGVMPQAQLVRFTPGSKAALVLNAQSIVGGRRLRMPFDQRVIDSFLAIKRKSLETEVGYESEANENIGHADDFWAFALAAFPEWGGSTDEMILI